MKLEKMNHTKSELFIKKIGSALAEADLVEISVKDSFGQNITGKLVEVFYDQKTDAPWIVIRKPYDSETSKVKLESGEKIIVHKTRVFTV
jgi:hypothetical protein